MKQESFTPTDDQLMIDVLEIAERFKQTKSKMIDILLHDAVKEKNRKRKTPKKVFPSGK
jgi:hypothetical protein